MASRSHQTRLESYARRHGLTMEELRATPMHMARARGHGQTPEHGKLFGAHKVVHTQNRTIRSTYSDRVAERAVNTAADHDNRVQIKVHTLAGQWKIIGGIRGYSGGYIAEKQAQAGGLRKAVTDGSISGSGGGKGIDSDPINDIDADDIDAWQIDELE